MGVFNLTYSLVELYRVILGFFLFLISSLIYLYASFVLEDSRHIPTEIYFKRETISS